MQRQVRRAYILILIGMAIVAVLVGFKYILPLFLPFVFGYFLAWLAAPIINLLKVRFRIPRGVGSFLIVSTFLFVFVTIIYLVVRTGLRQLIGLFTNLPGYQQLFLLRMKGVCTTCDHLLGIVDGTSYSVLLDKFNGFIVFVQDSMIPKETGETISAAKIVFDVIWKITLIFLSALLWGKDFNQYKEEFQSSCFYQEIHMVTGVLSEMGIAYLRAQLILMCVTGVICTIGFFCTGNHYAILAGAGVALFDAFPILGCSFILIPWALVLFLKKNILGAVIILITYAVCELVRQILEPRLIGNCIGIKPVYTLISMYVGLKIYGPFGFFLGPISLVAIQAIVKAGIEHLKKGTKK